MTQLKYDLSEIDKITSVYDKIILQSLDFEVEQDGKVTCACPIHGGDNQTAFSYCPRRKCWHCFTQKCHEKTGSGLIGLVQAIKGLDFNAAIEYILEITGQTLNKKTSQDIDRKLYIKEQNKQATKSNGKIFGKNILDGLSPNVEYFIKERGFSLDTLKTFGAFYCDSPYKVLHGRACLTIFNVNGEVIGFTGRKTSIIDTSPKIPKWRHAPKGIELENHLFGLDKAKDDIKNTGVAVLVEGPMDLMRLYEAGLRNVVCTLGTVFTKEHRRLLLQAGCKTLINAFDPDQGGDCGTNQILNNAHLYFNVVSIREQLTKDPGDMTVEEVKTIVVPILNKIIESELKKYA